MVANEQVANLPGAHGFRGRVVWVIGASRGIVADAARAFARRGAAVILSARDGEKLEQVERSITAEGGLAVSMPLDLMQESEVARVGGEIRARWRRLDAAFNNAGEGALPTPLADVPTDTFDRVLGVTVRGTFLAMKQQIPLMLDTGGGTIVNMSSTAGFQAFRGGGPYSAAKHAILGLTKAAALDYAQQHIRVNAVAPGPIDTDRLKAAPEEYRERTRQAVPMRRMGSGAEVADAVVWLCSEGSRFVTGASLTIDGGRLAGFA